MLSLLTKCQGCVQQGFCEKTCFVTVLIEKSQQNNEVLELLVKYFAIRITEQATSTNYWNTVESNLTISANLKEEFPYKKKTLNTPFCECKCRNTEKVCVKQVPTLNSQETTVQSGNLHSFYSYLFTERLSANNAFSYCLLSFTK